MQTKTKQSDEDNETEMVKQLEKQQTAKKAKEV